MNLASFLTPLRGRKKLQAPPNPHAPVSIVSPQGRSSWDLMGQGANYGPWFRIPQDENLRILAELRRQIPLLDRAVKLLKALVGVPTVEAEPDVKADLEEWMETVSANRVQTGFSNWLSTWLDDLLVYGRAHSEIILTNRRDDVHAVTELHPGTIFLRPQMDRYHVDVVQQQQGGEPVLLNPATMLNAYHEIREDNPNGTSLFYSLPFVAQVYVGILRATGQVWERFGNPTMHVNVEFPEGFNDPTGTLTKSIISGMRTDFESAMKSRAEGKVKDFFSAGTVAVTVVGAAGEALEIEEPERALLQQIVAATGLPPFLFGIQWATTERMSTVQASLLTETVQALRACVKSEILYLLQTRQRLSGGSDQFELAWPEVSLIDKLDQGQGDMYEQEAQAALLTNLNAMWRQGLCDEIYLAQRMRPDLANETEEEIRRALPKLGTKPPEEPKPLPGMLPNGNGSRPNAGSQGMRPTNGQKALGDVTAAVTHGDIERAVAVWNEIDPEFAGLLMAEVAEAE